MIEDPPPEHPAGAPAPEPWLIEEIYDPETVALIDDAPRGARTSGPPRGTGTMHAVTGDAPIDPGTAVVGSDPVTGPGRGPVLAEGSEPSSGAGDDPAASTNGGGRVRSGVAGLLMAGMMTGVAEVLDPDRLQPEMVEFSPDHPDPSTQPVQFVYVPGSPRASRLIIRPWLLGR